LNTSRLDGEPARRRTGERGSAIIRRCHIDDLLPHRWIARAAAT
jgi:hypothetical protein